MANNSVISDLNMVTLDIILDNGYGKNSIKFITNIV